MWYYYTHLWYSTWHAGTGQGNICWEDKQCGIQSLYRRGMLERTSSEAFTRWCPARTTRFCVQHWCNSACMAGVSVFQVHLIPWWLLSKLAKRIGENFWQDLCISLSSAVNGWWGVELYPGEQPGHQPGLQGTASDILLHSVGVWALQWKFTLTAPFL